MTLLECASPPNFKDRSTTLSVIFATVIFFSLFSSPEEVLEDPSLRLNASYYINKQILPPLDRVFALIGIDVSTW